MRTKTLTFLDEKRLFHGGTDGAACYLRTLRTERRQLSTRQQSWGFLMCWGDVSSYKNSNLVQVSDN